jgi:hypothetical protein
MIRFKYNGREVRISGEERDAVIIEVDGEDFTSFWDGRQPPEVWIKEHLNAQSNRSAEVNVSGREVGNAVVKDQEKEPDIAAPEAEIGIILDELGRLPEPARANGAKLIAEESMTSYAPGEAQKVPDTKGAEADGAIIQPKKARPEEDLGPKTLIIAVVIGVVLGLIQGLLDIIGRLSPFLLIGTIISGFIFGFSWITWTMIGIIVAAFVHGAFFRR